MSLGLLLLELSAEQTISGKISKDNTIVGEKFMPENIEKYPLTCGQEHNSNNHFCYLVGIFAVNVRKTFIFLHAREVLLGW